MRFLFCVLRLICTASCIIFGVWMCYVTMLSPAFFFKNHNHLFFFPVELSPWDVLSEIYYIELEHRISDIALTSAFCWWVYCVVCVVVCSPHAICARILSYVSNHKLYRLPFDVCTLFLSIIRKFRLSSRLMWLYVFIISSFHSLRVAFRVQPFGSVTWTAESTN